MWYCHTFIFQQRHLRKVRILNPSTQKQSGKTSSTKNHKKSGFLRWESRYLFLFIMNNLFLETFTWKIAIFKTFIIRNATLTCLLNFNGKINYDFLLDMWRIFFSSIHEFFKYLWVKLEFVNIIKALAMLRIIKIW